MTAKENAQSAAVRVFDANANRAAEGLRTLEDVARLGVEDAVAAGWAKSLRHELAEASRGVAREDRLLVRSTQSDAGTELTNESEQSRFSTSEIVEAACERVTQSLRCLEEFGKLLDPEVAQRCKQLRYKAYDRLASLELRLARGRFAMLGQLYLLLDCSLEKTKFKRYVAELAEAGVDYFQIRDKQADGARLLSYTRLAMEAIEATSANVFVNDRVDVALAAGAYGVHIGQEDLPLEQTINLARGRLCVGVSTHSLEQAQLAEREGADYIGCGPTFPSKTKAFEDFPGTDFLDQVQGNVRLPYFAIGGISRLNLDEVLRVGCRRVAVSQAIGAAEHPVEAAADLKQRLVEAESQAGKHAAS